MKLLICTQKVDKNDSVLGFFHRWLEEFAKHCESVIVICLEKGEYYLPENVKVFCLGKSVHISHITYHISILKKMWYMIKFYGYIWKHRNEYDHVFVHMNPEYALMAGWLWKVMSKRINLWYVHRQVNLKLRIAAFFANKIFSAAPGSIGLKSKKVKFVGHGIDTEFFKCENRQKNPDVFKIISVGRITRIKNLDILIKAISLLRERIERKFLVELVGEPATDDDREYKIKLGKLISDLSLEDIVKFSGVKLYAELPRIYCQSDLLINLAPTGGLDKVVLEAMSCGLLVLLSNKSFLPFLNNFGSQLLFEYQNCEDLANKIQNLLAVDRRRVGLVLREQVATQHELKSLVAKLIKAMSQ